MRKKRGGKRAAERSRRARNARESISMTLEGYRAVIAVVVVFTLISYGVHLAVESNPPLAQLLSLSRDSPWGVLTSLFLHVEAEHLLSNLEALFAVSIIFCAVIHVYPLKMRKMWSSVFAALFFVSGAGSNAVEYLILLMGRNVRSWGGSGMVYGARGVLMVAAIASVPDQVARIAGKRTASGRRSSPLTELAKRLLSAFSLVLVAFLLWGLFTDMGGFFGEGPNIDLTSHVLGFLIGMAGATGFFIRAPRQRNRSGSSRPR